MKQSILLFLIFFLAFPFAGQSQYFSTGQDPAQIKWRQINTEHFQLIYPEEYESKAQQVAWIFDHVYQYGYRTLNHAPQKISVILHTHTIKSNGLVAWSPKRVELFTTPDQNIYAQDWLEQLAVHEFRHVVQMDKIQDELPRILPILFGEQAAAAVVGAYLPFWFIEGDAVATETALTHAGRGRMASFLMENKAQALEKGLYSYNKASLGSYKDFVPNRYNFGYWMVGGVREKYGSKIWSDVLDQIAQKPLSINPVDRVLKKETGLNQADLYQKLFSDYRSSWKKQLDQLKLTPLKNITATTSNYTQYTQANWINDSSQVVLKNSRSDISRIEQITPSGEKVITSPGSILSNSFSSEGNLLIWSEQRPDIRWTHADKSVIVVYNRETGSKQEFHSGNKLFSPKISPDLLHFVTVEVDKNNNYFLSVFDLFTGKKINQFSTPDNDFFLTPCWDNEGDNLYFIVLDSSGKSLCQLNLRSGKFKKLLDAGYEEIRNPYFFNGNIYFTGSFTGIDNIYEYQLESQKTVQLSSVSFGADYPTVLNNKLLFSNYTANGYQLAQMNLKDALWKPFRSIHANSYALADSLASQEDTVFNFSDKDKANFPSKHYSKIGHLFNIHSWAPVYISTDNYDVKPGISLFSQNKLGTSETRLGYEYNWTERTGKYLANFKYTGLFPVINTQVNYGRRSSNYYLIKNTIDQSGSVTSSDTTRQRFEWNEFSFDGNVYVPLHFSQGKYSQLIQPNISYSYKSLSHTNSTPDDFYSGYYSSLLYQLYLQNTRASSELDIIPRWAQTLELSYRSSLGRGSDIGYLMAAQSYLFFPGLLKNQGIKIYAGYQKKQVGPSLAFGNTIRFPRGWQSFQNTEMSSTGIDYVMPLLYPDFSLGRFIYLKRVRTSLFYDYAKVKGNVYSDNGDVRDQFSLSLSSVGAEILGDAHVLRLIAPVSAGVRGIYLPTAKTFEFQFLISINVNSF